MINGYHPVRAMTDPAGAAAPTSKWTARRYLLVLGLVSALIAAAVVVVPSVVARAASQSYNLVVNSTAWGGEDASKGDGKCAIKTGECTLRAAIEESNALKGAPGEITITVSSGIPIGTKMTVVNGISSGSNPNATANRMLTSSLSAQDDDGAYFEVTYPVTIDLGHRLQVDGSASDSNEGAAFYLNGPDIQVLNADQVQSPGSSFLVGPNANRVMIDGDTAGGFAQISTPTWNPERFVVFREGASNVTVRNYQVEGYYNNVDDTGIFVFDAYSPYTPMANITIDRIQVLYSSGIACDRCRTRLTNFWNGGSTNWNGSNVTINGLTFTNMLIQNMTGQYAFYLGAASNSPAISNLTIDNNLFLSNRSNGTAFITLPYGNKLAGTSSISNNVFTRSTTDKYAIYYSGAQGANSTTASNLTIKGNYFNGYTGGATIYTGAAGLVTVMGNTFGKDTGSQTTTANEEYTDSASLMYNAYHSPTYSTNRSVRTWAPTAASMLTQADSSAVVMEDPRDGEMSTCPATVSVSKILDMDNTTLKADAPVIIQAYWTSGTKAEVYLGQAEVTSGTSAKLQVPLPVGTVTLPDGTATIVNPDTGSAGGYIRLQTHLKGLPQLASSQYSRTVAVTGNCRPVLTINQKDSDPKSDPTYGRDLHFVLTSSLPLDPGTVTADDIEVTASAVAETINASVLRDPHVISVTPLDTDNTQFDVVVRVDDSAKVSVRVDRNKVDTPAGLNNQNPATYTDNSITFLNPLKVTPPSFTLVTGEPKGKTFTISIAAGAPPPTADVVFVATVNQPSGTPDLSLSTNGPILRIGQTSTDPVTVTAAAEPPVAANTLTTITMTVDSSDTNYSGLVVPGVTPYLFSTDPTIRITKEAYVDVKDTSSVEGVEAGTYAASGTRLMDRQTVCFVYTVTNLSQNDDWATNLKDIEVRDSDTRLGKDGLINPDAPLVVPKGKSAKLFACTSLLPVDTTIGN